MTFAAARDAFLTALKARTDARFAKDYPNLTPPTYTYETGSRYVKIVTNDGPSRSVFCFLRIADGAVLKAASWKAPAKHARGSIYANAGMDACSDYGAHYMR